MSQPNVESPAVTAHLQMLQSIITRMATNSAACKTWCVTIVSAMLVVMADKGKYECAFVALVPVILFFLLDAYYLHLEKCFIGSYNKFLGLVHSGAATDKDLFKIIPPTGLMTMCSGVKNSVQSVAVWPFYTTIGALCIIAGAYLAVPKADAKPASSPSPIIVPTTKTSSPTTK